MRQKLLTVVLSFPQIQLILPFLCAFKLYLQGTSVAQRIELEND